MKKITLIIFCISASVALFAQNEAYHGGTADGHTLSAQVTAFGNADIFQPYFGGNTDGFAKDVLLNFNQYASVNMFSPFFGSSADGHAADSIISFPQHGSINMFAPFVNGGGDGHAGDSVITFNQHAYISMFQPYASAQADGWTSYPVFGIVVVPVTLLSFTGEQLDKKDILHWTTSQEENTSHFDLERSADGVHFAKIGTVAAAGNSNTEKYYQYIDAIPMQGNNFYRLNIFDLDGTSKYSNIILLKLSGNTSMSIYPNPTAKTLNIKMDGVADNTEVRATIFDIGGKYVTGMTVKKANASFSFDVDHLAAGVYILQVVYNNETTVWRFIKN